MSERTIIGGVSYEAIGSSTSNLLLKCNGTARIQWGSKLIDLIKNGKIALTNSENQDGDILFKGMIVMLNSSSEIPQGWAKCDGNTHEYNGNTYTTPNLNDSSNPQLIYIMKL